MPDCWLAPNTQSDLLRLFREPHLWPKARARTAAFQLYAMQILEGGAYQPNGYTALCEAGVFDKLHAWQIPLSVEIGVVKEGTPGRCDGSDGAREAGEIIHRVQAAGGTVGHFSIDSALNSGLGPCGLSVEAVAARVSEFIAEFRPVVPSIGVIEAYPAQRVGVLIEYLQHMKASGERPSFLHLDVDRLAVRDARISDKTLSEDLRTIADLCRLFQVTFGVIVWGQNLTKRSDYRPDALAWREHAQDLLGVAPARWIVQSWEPTRGVKVYPNTVPESDPASMTAVLLDVLDPPAVPWWRKVWRSIVGVFR